LRKPQPVLTGASALTYYNLVEQLQAHHGQETLIGKRLGALTAGVSGARTTLVLQEFPWPQRSWRGATRDESGNLEVRSVHAGNPWPVRSRRSRSRVERDRRNDRLSWKPMRDRAGTYGANVRRWRFQVTSYAAPCAKAATKTDLRVRRQNESRLVAAHHMSQGKLRLRTGSNACMLRSATVNRPIATLVIKFAGSFQAHTARVKTSEALSCTFAPR